MILGLDIYKIFVHSNAFVNVCGVNPRGMSKGARHTHSA